MSRTPTVLKGVVYRPHDTFDAEERLEDAAMGKAIHDVFGAGVTHVPHDAKLQADVLLLGRMSRTEGILRNVSPYRNPGLSYWKDPAFLDAALRNVYLCDTQEAEARVKEIHAAGKDAFLKATWQKFYTGKVPRGTSFGEAVGDIIYSFIDYGQCLLVQDFIPMSCERRFLVVDRKVVTESPVASTLTPLDRASARMGGARIDELHFRHPNDLSGFVDSGLASRMRHLARSIAADAVEPSFCLDLCLTGDDPDRDPIAAIEFNPLQPGQVGLFGCDPYALAQGVLASLDPELRALVEARRDGRLEPLPIEEAILGNPGAETSTGKGAAPVTPTVAAGLALPFLDNSGDEEGLPQPSASEGSHDADQDWMDFDA